MKKLTARAEIDSPLPKYKIVVETTQSRHRYETSIIPLVNKIPQKPLFKIPSGTIVTALETHKHYIKQTLRYINNQPGSSY